MPKDNTERGFLIAVLAMFGLGIIVMIAGVIFGHGDNRSLICLCGFSILLLAAAGARIGLIILRSRKKDQ